MHMFCDNSLVWSTFSVDLCAIVNVYTLCTWKQRLILSQSWSWSWGWAFSIRCIEDTRHPFLVGWFGFPWPVKAGQLWTTRWGASKRIDVRELDLISYWVRGSTSCCSGCPYGHQYSSLCLLVIFKLKETCCFYNGQKTAPWPLLPRTIYKSVCSCRKIAWSVTMTQTHNACITHALQHTYMWISVLVTFLACTLL